MVEQRAKQQEAEPKAEAKEKRGRPTADVPTFPRNSLKESVAVAKAIWIESSGEPFDPILLANALKTTRRSSWFDNILRSSERYGLTSGTVWSNRISLTELGKAIAAPTDESQIGSNLRKALMTPKLFNEFYEKYNRKPILKDVVLKNVLETTFKVRRSDILACQSVLLKNITEYDLKLQQGQESLLWLDNLGKAAAVILPVEQTADHGIASSEADTLPREQGAASPQAPPAQETVVKVPRVFISHSKNKKILDNIKQMLSFGKFDYRVAEEKETLSIPLSDKVFGLMQECNCAIINVSADQERKQGDAYGINENVLIEIGAAFLHYNKRVLLVIDQKFKEKLPSILQGITAIFYEGHELSLSDCMKLMQALGEFRNKL